jgi:enoyl-CoA hydratase
MPLNDLSPDATDLIGITKYDRVTVISLRRPEKRNALNHEMRAGLRSAFDDYEADPGQRCAILTAEGSVFCAGGDLTEMAATTLKVPSSEWTQLVGSSPITKPVIAAVNGPALAGGFNLMQACDLCIASASATFGIAEVRRGRGSPWATPLGSMLPRRIMMELLITGIPITAQRAYDVGLVNQVVPDSELFDSALALARVIAGNAPLSVAAGKRLVELVADLGPTLAAKPADWLYERVYLSDDAQEGPRAFNEHREPDWTGH